MIPMLGGFTVVPEGEHVFRIYDVTYDETFGRLIVKMVTAEGLTHQERFSLKNADDSYNEGALKAFSFFAKNALNNFAIENVDPITLVNRYIKAEVKHTITPNKNDPTKDMTWVNLGMKYPADGFDKEPCEKALKLGNFEEDKPADSSLNLDNLLG